jgi:S1-C subfamily serine protease
LAGGIRALRKIARWLLSASTSVAIRLWCGRLVLQWIKKMRRLLSIAALALLAGCAAHGTVAPRSSAINEAVASSLQVVTERQNDMRRSGSGVLVADGNGGLVILTAAHVLLPLEEQRIYLRTGPDAPAVPTTLLAIDEAADVAVLAATLAGLSPATMRDAAALGDPIWVVAYPWGRERTLVGGIVSQLASIQDKAAAGSGNIPAPVKLIDVSVAHGMSGGGVFDAETGDLVGLVRGYRSVTLSAKVTGDQRYVYPVAGETTVISSTLLSCVMADAASAAPGGATRSDCLPAHEKAELAAAQQ